MSEEPLTLMHPEDSDTVRLDRFLQTHLSNLEEPIEVTRSQLQRWIESSGALVNNKQVFKSGSPVKAGAVVVFVPQYEDETGIEPYEFPLSVLYEDQFLIVIDKPPGLTVHPGAGNPNKTMLNALVAYFKEHQDNFADGVRPGIVHRLDRDTSGVLVVARDPATHAGLSSQFSRRTVDRAYKTLVLSTPRAKREIDRSETGEVSAPIGRDPSNRLKMGIVPGGKPATTRWKVLARYGHANLLEVKLLTGRTHQIRVHLDSVGSPIIGDKTYGDCSALPTVLQRISDGFGRQALHAFQLGFDHPRTEERMLFESELPNDFLDLVGKFQNFGQEEV